MDPSTYHDLWVNLATNSPFLAWMIYSYVQTNKQLEQTRAENRTERIEMQNQQRADEERIRNRFEMVISDLNTDRRHLVEGFSNRIDSLERGQKKIFAILEPLKDQIQEIRVKEQLKKELANGG
jgi:hypothetical protein